MTSLSRPAQDSLALRPVRLQAHPSCALTPRLRHGRLPRRTAWVATEVNRKLLGRISHPLVLHAFVAHWLSPIIRRNTAVLFIRYSIHLIHMLEC